MERENQDIHSKEYMVTTFEIAHLWNIHQCNELVIRIVWRDDTKEIPMTWKLFIAVHVQQIVVNAERINTYMLWEAFIFQVSRAYDHQCHSQIYEQYNLHQRFQMVLAFESLTYIA